MILQDEAVKFDEAKHEYRDADDMVYPSVTTILKPWSLLSNVPPQAMEAARCRGDLVHYATELDDRGLLNEESAGDDVMAYVRVWREFRRHWDYVPTMIERRFIHKRFGYAGTLDRWGHGRNPKTKRQTPILLDIKTGQPDPTHGPQTAAYAAMVDAGMKDMRMTVYLRPDTFEIEEHTSISDWSTFMAALQWHRWRKKHNL